MKLNQSTEIPPGYTRVTEVLNPFSKLHLLDPSTVQKAADRGKRVHKFCTLHALNMLIVDVDEDCKGYVESFKTWFNDSVEKVIMEPTRINSPQCKLSGEFDMILQIKGDSGATLIDIKTPATQTPSWALQTAAYKMLVEDELCQEIDRRAVIQLPKDGSKARFIEFTDDEYDLDLYIKALELFRFFYG